MTDAELEDIERACAEATPGPWACVSDSRDDEDHIVSEADGQSGAGTIATARRYLPPAEPSAEGKFIAGARSWLPALLAEVRSLRCGAAQRELLMGLPVPDGLLEGARAEEREACAKLADADAEASPTMRLAAGSFGAGASERTARRIAAAIRARGET